MKKCLLIFYLLIFSCSHLPTLHYQKSGINKKNFFISIYPQGSVKYIHSITMSIGGNDNNFIGVVEINNQLKRISVYMMTLEGFVFFEAVKNNSELVIKKALNQLNSKNFAKGLFRDISLIFTMPEFVKIIEGVDKSNKKIRRLYQQENQIIDYSIKGNMVYAKIYKGKYSLIKTVIWSKSSTSKYPIIIELKSFSFIPYKMKMRLVRTEKIKN